MKKIILVLIFLSINLKSPLGQESMSFNQKNPSTLEVISNGEIFNYNNQNFIALVIDLEDGWKTYWKNPGDSGAPLEMTWERNSIIDSFEILYPTPKRYFDSGIETIGYSKKVIFPVKIELNEYKNMTIDLEINYLVCKEICIPISVTKKILFKNKNLIKKIKNIEFEEVIKKIPIYQNFFFISNQKRLSDKEIKLNISTNINIEEKNLDIFIFNENNDFEKKVVIKDKNILDLYLKSDNEIISDNKMSILFSQNDLSSEIIILPEKKSLKSSMYKMIFFALLGGIILNFMPCVLPVLSLKIYSLISISSQEKHNFSKMIILTISGIYFSFLIISLITVFLKTLSIDVGWGFQFQSKEFLVLFSIILFVFSMNLFGFFEIILPSSLMKKIEISSKNKYLNSFFSGLLATLLATPCSAPFLGTSVGYALMNDNITIFLIFISLATGFSLPYFMILISPNLINFFPRPGVWMIYFKKILGTLVLLTSFWLLKILVFNDYFLLLFLLIFPLASLYFSKNKIKYRGVISLVFILVFSFFADSLLDEKVKKNNWQIFNENKLNKLINENRVIFVDVTADWCITCQVNKTMVLNNQTISKFFVSNNVELLKADWTKKSPEILGYISNYNKYGIPFNIVYGPSNKEGIILQEILTKDSVIKSIKMVK